MSCKVLQHVKWIYTFYLCIDEAILQYHVQEIKSWFNFIDWRRKIQSQKKVGKEFLWIWYWKLLWFVMLQKKIKITWKFLN